MKGNFRSFINEYKFDVFHKVMILLLKIAIYRQMQLAIQGMPHLSYYKFKQQEKDPQSFLKDLKTKNINRLITGQLNINSLRNIYLP